MKTDIIGHRGAAGLALENSTAAITKAVKLGVPQLEIDVRLTADGQLVLCHDPDLMRVARDTRRIADCPSAELASVVLNDGSSLLSLAEAMQLIGSTPVIIEVKDSGSVRALLKVLREFPKAQVSVSSFVHEELIELKKRRPTWTLYAATFARPLHTIRVSRRHKLGAVALFVGTLNPLTYWLLKRAKLQAFTYTANSSLVVGLLRRWFPGVAICTNYPNRFMK